MMAQAGFLGVKTSNGSVVEVLDISSQSGAVTVFTTIADGQKRARFDFYHRSRRSADWVYLDSLPVQFIPPAPAGKPDLPVKLSPIGGERLLLEMGGPRPGESRVFSLDLSVLIARCREGQPAAGRAARADCGAPGRPQSPHCPPSPQSPLRPRRWFWVPLAALAAAALALVFLFDQGLFLPASEEEAISADVSPAAGPSPPPISAAPEPEAAQARPVAPADSESEAAAADRTAESGLPDTAVEATSEGGAGREGSLPLVEQPESQRRFHHRITWGETLWRITERYYGNRDLFPELAERNRLADPDIIIAGQSLELPDSLGEGAVILKTEDDASETDRRQ
jgi:hypothetical protein